MSIKKAPCTILTRRLNLKNDRAFAFLWEPLHMPFTGHSITLIVFLQHKSPRFHAGFYAFNTFPTRKVSSLHIPGLSSLMGYGGIGPVISKEILYDNVYVITRPKIRQLLSLFFFWYTGFDAFHCSYVMPFKSLL